MSRFNPCSPGVRWTWWLITLAFALVPIVALAAVLVPSRKPTPGSSRGAASPPRAAAVVRVEPTFRAPGSLDGARIAEAVSRMAIGKPTNLSTLLHALRLFGPEATVPGRETGQRVGVLAVALDHQAGVAYFGQEPTLIDTREGVRCRVAERQYADKQSERQAHPGQLLAVLAETGIPLDQPIRTPRGERTVRRVLDDTLANFDPKQHEIEWTAAALALYLPPQRSWANKYGETFTLDDLAKELMSRPFDGAIACGGTHLLYSLVTLLRADEQRPVLSDPVRREVRDRLRRTAESLTRTQLSDGSWDQAWRGPLPGAGEEAGDKEGHKEGDGHDHHTTPQPIRVMLTGHHLEWVLLLPSDLQPPSGHLLRAARWLLERALNDPLTMIDENYCPYSHAGRVLLMIDGSMPPLSGRGDGNRRAASAR